MLKSQVAKTKMKLKGGKKKDNMTESDDDYWQEKPERKFNFDDENDESNQTDFLG